MRVPNCQWMAWGEGMEGGGGSRSVATFILPSQATQNNILDIEGSQKQMIISLNNIVVPYLHFGNCDRAAILGPPCGQPVSKMHGSLLSSDCIILSHVYAGVYIR